MADIKIAGRIKAGTADNIAGYASEILFDDEASDKTVKEKIEEVANSPQAMIVSISSDDNGGYEADKTFAEIKSFLDNGGTVVAKDDIDGDSYYYLDNYIASEVVFTRNIWGSGGFTTRYYTIDNTNTVSFIDAAHSISSSVNSSSTTEIANSAAVKTVNDKVAGKADKSEMSVVAGTGANADKTTITLKNGTSATVLTQHQDISEFLREGEVFGSGDDSAASFNSYADTVWNKQQTLSESQKQQVRENIGITDLETIRNGAAAGATAIQSVTVGTTTTGAAGSSASVVNSGTATAPVLDFTIPQGAQGIKGDTVIMGNEDTYTLYNTTGDAVDGAMTQQAVTRELAELAGYEHSTDIAFSNSGSLWNGTPSSSTINNYTGKIKLADYDKVLYTGLSHGSAVTYWTGDTGGTFDSQLTQVQLVGSETDAIDVDVKAIAPTTATYVQLCTANSTHANPPSVTPSVTCINYTTVKSVVEEIQSASYEDKSLGVGKIISLNAKNGVCVNEYEFEIGKKYEITISVDSALSYGCTAYLRVSPDYNSNGISIGEGLTLLSGETEATVIYTPASTNYKYFTLWNTDNKNHNTILNVSVKEKSANLLSTLSSLNADMYGGCIDTYSLSHTGEGLSSYRGYYDFVVGRRYKIIAQSLSDATSGIGIYLYPNYKNTRGEGVIQVGRIVAGERISEFVYSPANNSNYHYIGSYSTETHSISVQVIDITDAIKDRTAALEEKVSAIDDNIQINSSEVVLDLSGSLIDFSTVSYRTGKSFNTELTEIDTGGWSVIDEYVSVTEGQYFMHTSSAGGYYPRIAFYNDSNEIVRVLMQNDYEDGFQVLQVDIDRLGITKMKISVHTTIESVIRGLVLKRGVFYRITDIEKASSFSQIKEKLGYVNVANFLGTDTARIQAAVNMASPYGTVYIPDGDYSITNTIYLNHSQRLLMGKNARLSAADGFVGDWMFVLKESSLGLSDKYWVRPEGGISSTKNNFVKGGMLLCNGNCSGLKVYKFRGFDISGVYVENPKTVGIGVYTDGYEAHVHDCTVSVHVLTNLTNTIGFDISCNDCNISDCVTIDCIIGFKLSHSCFASRCHPWFGSVKDSNNESVYINGSIGFNITGQGVVLNQCYADTAQTAFKSTYSCVLIGCTNYVNSAFTVNNPVLFNFSQSSKVIGFINRGTTNIVGTTPEIIGSFGI